MADGATHELDIILFFSNELDMNLRVGSHGILVYPHGIGCFPGTSDV